MRNVDGLGTRDEECRWVEVEGLLVGGGRSFGGKVGGGEFRRGLLWRMMGGRVV